MCAEPNTQTRRQFPTAFTILFLIMLLAIALTRIIPAGAYAKLSYNATSHMLTINTPQGETRRVPATQDELTRLDINIGVEQFVNGTIRKPIAIPGTYERLAQAPKGLSDVAVSMVKGTIEGADIIVFILVLGGLSASSTRPAPSMPDWWRCRARPGATSSCLSRWSAL